MLVQALLHWKLTVPPSLPLLQLNFVGMTVQRGQPYLHITTTRHVFTPVAIGSPSPPKQVSRGTHAAGQGG